jgi:Cu-processing system permease protein
MNVLRATGVIAWTTTLEALRNKLLLIGIAFGLVLVGLSVTAAAIVIGERARLIIDVGLAAASVIGTIMTIAVTVTGFAGELRKHTAFPILARPVSRSTFILGKYIGIVAAMSMVVTIMIIATVLTTWLYGDAVPAAVWWQWLLALVEVAVVAAIALLFSTLAVPALAAMYTGGVVIAGNLANDVMHISNNQIEEGQASGFILRAVYYVLPDLQNLSVRAQAANVLPVPHTFVAYGVGYGLAYAAATLLFAMIVFSRRRAI